MVDENKILSSATASMFLLKERFEIIFDNALPELNANGAKAYEVKDKINLSSQLFALICNNDHPPRMSILPYLKSMNHPNLLKLVEFGVVDYRIRNSQNVALIYQKPTGGKVNSFSLNDSQSLKHIENVKALTLSMVSAVEALKGYGITHRALRVDNMFYKDSDCSEIVLGDCAAAFPGFFQPSVYETIENLLCLPEGKGNGSNKQDMYSIGVCLLSIFFQGELLKSFNSAEILRLKLKKNSYGCLLEDKKLPPKMNGLIKSLLDDEEDNRWTYLNIYNYLDNKMNVTFSSELADEASRAFIFNNEKYYTSRDAAIAMINNQEEALGAIKSGKLVEWVKNGFDNAKMLAKIEEVVKRNIVGDVVSSAVVCQACYVLYPSLPIKSGDVAIFPDGLSKAIYYYQRKNKKIDDFINVINSDIIKFWYQEQEYLRSPANLGEFKLFISRKQYGYGLERIMYEFDDLPCTSPLIGNKFVNTPSRLLKALDENFSEKNAKQPPYDYNIIAFLRCKMGSKIDGNLVDLNSTQDYIKASAILRLYTSIQNKNGPVVLSGLSQWMLNIYFIIIKNYHNKKYQEYLEQKVTKIYKNGKLAQVYGLIENADTKQKDKLDYADAIKEINSLTSRRAKIKNAVLDFNEESKVGVLKFVSVISIFIMISSFTLSLIYWIL